MCRISISIILIVSNYLKLVQSVKVVKSEKLSFSGFNPTDFVANLGYPIQVHKNIQTEDGYLLDILRIPPLNQSRIKSPVFLMHGLGGSAENWIIMGRERGLAFILADLGYDVWMGNARGNTHSKKHIRLAPNTAEFWNFSWHEIGYFDLPASINYILKYTNHSKLFYIGHSQGTTSFFVMASSRPQMNKSIRLMVALAPAVFLSLERLPLPYASLAFENIEQYRRLLNINEIGPAVREIACNQFFSNDGTCAGFTAIFAGPGELSDSDLTPATKSRIEKTFPDSASARQYLHYLQVGILSKFQQYDFGANENMKIYQKRSPPKYNLSKISSPVAIFFGQADILVTPENVERLSQLLPRVVLKYLVADPKFTHLNFLTHRNVVKLLYDRVIATMNIY